MQPPHSTVPGTETQADLDEINDEIVRVRHLLTIVEGPKDRRALERLGFTHVTHLDRPLFQIVEQIGDEEILLLTDLDEHGRHLYKRLYADLTGRGVRVNNRLRLLLFRTPVRHIEGLETYLRRVEGKTI